MKASDILATIGVIILLIAFGLNLYKKLPANSKTYGWLNLIGAGICCYSSWLIGFYPFVVLECVWACAALLSLFNVPRGTSIEINDFSIETQYLRLLIGKRWILTTHLMHFVETQNIASPMPKDGFATWQSRPRDAGVASLQNVPRGT